MLLYQKGPSEKLFRNMRSIMEGTQLSSAHGGLHKEEAADKMNACLPLFLEYGMTRGFRGNLWQAYLTELLLTDENAFSLACERRKQPRGSILQAAKKDLAEYRKLFIYDFAPLANFLNVTDFSMVTDFVPADDESRVFPAFTRDKIQLLVQDLAAAADDKEFLKQLTAFYGTYGVGTAGLYKGFRIVEEGYDGTLKPIRETSAARLDDLVGYDSAKKKLLANTQAFLKGRPANNVLLYGEAGTGKSTCIKSICNMYYEQGIRVIEVYKYQYRALGSIIRQIRDRNYRFILFMDDLSFEEFETEYKYLKAIIEGGLEERPENVLIYATSNRRHLIRESFADRDGLDIGDKHTGDTMQEKLSLSDRFGLTIYFESPAQQEYHRIVEELALRAGIRMPKETLRLEATRWEMQHGGPSGRAAQQFIDFLRGQEP